MSLASRGRIRGRGLAIRGGRAWHSGRRIIHPWRGGPARHPCRAFAHKGASAALPGLTTGVAMAQRRDALHRHPWGPNRVTRELYRASFSTRFGPIIDSDSSVCMETLGQGVRTEVTGYLGLSLDNDRLPETASVCPGKSLGQPLGENA